MVHLLICVGMQINLFAVASSDRRKALEPIAGTYTGALFAIAFIGSGILAVPVFAAAEHHVHLKGRAGRDAARGSRSKMPTSLTSSHSL